DRAPIDVAVLPTLARESYSFILDEAVRLGVPILASDAGALAERATGRVALFRRNDPADLATKLDQLADDPTRIDRMRAAPPPATLTFAEHVRRLEEICIAVIDDGAPPAPPNDDLMRLR